MSTPNRGEDRLLNDVSVDNVDDEIFVNENNDDNGIVHNDDNTMNALHVDMAYDVRDDMIHVRNAIVIRDRDKFKDHLPRATLHDPLSPSRRQPARGAQLPVRLSDYQVQTPTPSPARTGSIGPRPPSLRRTNSAPAQPASLAPLLPPPQLTALTSRSLSSDKPTRSMASLSTHVNHKGVAHSLFKAINDVPVSPSEPTAPRTPATTFSPARVSYIPPMGTDHLEHFNALLGSPGRPAPPRQPPRLSSLHPPTDDPGRPHTRENRPAGVGVSNTNASTFTCGACAHVCRSRHDKTEHIRTTHMLGQLADPATMKMAGVPACQRCGTYIVSGKPSTHEDNCRYQYDGSEHQGSLDRLTSVMRKWMELTQERMICALSIIPWPDASLRAPAHIHLPRASQMKTAMACVLSRIADLCAQRSPDYTAQALKLLAWLPRWVLTASPTAKTPAEMDQLAVARMILVLEGEYADLAAGYLSLCNQWREVTRSDQEVAANRYKRAEILIKHAQLSDAASTLVSSTPLANTRDPHVFTALLAKFKSDQQPPHFPTPNSLHAAAFTRPAPISRIKTDDLISIIKKKKKITSGGLSGLRYNHMEELLPFNIGEPLRIIVQTMMTVDPDSNAWQCFTAAALTVLDKDVNAPPTKKDVRPIAVQDVWLRLLATAIWETEGREVARVLLLQLGTGVKFGCAQVALLAQQIWDCDPDTVILQADIKNGYGAISRVYLEKILAARIDNFPLLHGYYTRLYGQTSTLFTSTGERLVMTDGILQGDPLSPVLFCLAVDDAIRAANKEASNGVVTAYIDDNTAAVKADALPKVLAALDAALAPTGAILHPNKCQVLLSRSGAHVPANVPTFIKPVPDGLTILGVPVGSSEYQRKWCLEALQGVRELVTKIDMLQYYQSRLLMLRFVVASKITHIARTVPPSVFSDFAAEFNLVVSNSLSKIITHCNTFDSRYPDLDPGGSQIYAPLHAGGLGLSNISDNAPFAFLAAFREHSYALSKLLGKKYTHILSRWTTLNLPAVADLTAAKSELGRFLPAGPGVTSELCHLPPSPYPAHLQHIYTTALDSDRRARLDGRFRDAALAPTTDHNLFEENNRQYIRRLAVQEPGAMSFLNITTLARMNRADNHSFSLMLRRVLGMSVLPRGTPDMMCPYCDKTILSSAHALTCHLEDTRRHNAVRDSFHRMMAGIGANWTKEPPTGVDSKRWDTVSHGLLLDGVARYYDYTVVDPASAEWCRRFNPFPKGSLEPRYQEAKEAKLKHYRQDIDRLRATDPTATFHVLPFSSYGGIGQAPLKVIQLIGSIAKEKRHPSSTWLTSTSYASYFMAACSFQIHLFTAKSIRRSPADALLKLLGSVGSRPSAGSVLALDVATLGATTITTTTTTTYPYNPQPHRPAPPVHSLPSDPQHSCYLRRTPALLFPSPPVRFHPHPRPSSPPHAATSPDVPATCPAPPTPDVAPPAATNAHTFLNTTLEAMNLS